MRSPAQWFYRRNEKSAESNSRIIVIAAKNKELRPIRRKRREILMRNIESAAIVHLDDKRLERHSSQMFTE